MVAKMKQPDRSLVATLDPFMTAHGFKFIGTHGGYYRKYSGGFDRFSWGSYPLATGEKWEAGYYEGHYAIALRNDAIDALTSIVMPLYGGERYQRYATTASRAVGWAGDYFAFDATRDRELCLRFDHLEEDVAETAGRIAAMLEADGWGWYERYADPVALSQGINDPLGGVAPHPLVNNVNQRPLVGVAAACVGEPDRVPALIDGWLSVAREWDEQAEGARPPMAPDFARKFALITDKARELGYLG
jgi:hypothetical protein